MGGGRSSGELIRFARFELDKHSGELRRDGNRIRLQEQPLQILQILLEQPGRIFTREELRQKIWPSDTFVDFDHGINNAIKRLREALGDTAETPRFIETLPKRGYRFIASCGVEASETPACIQSLAVLPLENLSGDPKEEYFADGMTEALITNLAKISALQVVSRTSAMHYKGVHRPVREIARELQVDAIVEGTVARFGPRVRISAQLIHAHSDSHLWAESYNRDLSDVLDLQFEVARAIAREVQVKLSPHEHTQLTRSRTVVPEAYEAYLRGRHYWNKRTGEAMKQGLVCFERAVELDPTYAAAHSGLADSAAVLGWWGFAPPEQGLLRAKHAAQTALSLDPTYADPHACLGFSMLHHDHDYASSEAAFQRARELNPRYATGAQWYGILLCLTGRVDESLAEMQRAIRLDPMSSVINWTFAHFLFFSRRFEDTLEQGRKLRALDPDSGHSRQVLGIAWEELGKHDVALAELKQACRISGCNPNFLGCLGYAYAGAELKDRAAETISQLQELFPQPYPVAYWIAMIHANLGNAEEACRWLEIGYAERAAQMVYLKVDPRFDKLRSAPRFQSILERMHFPA